MAAWLSHIPDCGVKLKGEDDVMVVADLADEAALGTQVAVVDVLGGKLDQRLEESFIYTLCDLRRASTGPSCGSRHLVPSPCAGQAEPRRPPAPVL